MRVKAMVVAVLVAGTAMVGGGQPAGAAVVVTSVGTTVTALVTGQAGVPVEPSCQGGSVRVGGVAAIPAVACTAVTQITITADGASQILSSEATPSGSMPALASVSIDAGGGEDDVTGSLVADDITLGAGEDEVWLPAEGGDDTVDAEPAEIEGLTIIGTDDDDEIVVATTDLESDENTYTNGDWSAVVLGAVNPFVYGGDGDDVIDASGVAIGTTNGLALHGEAGDDDLSASPYGTALFGGPGANLLEGAEGGDGTSFITVSAADDFIGVGDEDTIHDSAGPVGRDLSGVGPADDLTYSVDVQGNTGIRVVPVGEGGAAITVTGARTGRQILPAAFDAIRLGTHGGQAPQDHAVIEIVKLTGQTIYIPGAAGTIVDAITPPTGGPFKNIHVEGAGARTRTRPALADANDRFAYRVLRDLPADLPVIDEAAEGGEALRAGLTTRTEAAVELTSADRFRNVQVDGAYAEILGRSVDTAGRAYWSGRLRDGLILRKLRASFYGTPEAVAQRGGTNGSYVTAVYEEVLGRTPAPAEVAYWVAQIEQVGLPRGTVADRFLNTVEARTGYILDRFLAFVDRAPTASEVQTWLPIVGSSRTDGRLALIRSLAASRAAFTRPEV